MNKKRSVGVSVLGICDILWGFPLLLTTLMLQGSLFHLLLALFYFVGGIGLFCCNAKIRKLFLYGAGVASILASLTVFALSSKDVPSYYQTPISVGLKINTITVIFPYFINLYFLTRPKVKEQFINKNNQEAQ